MEWSPERRLLTADSAPLTSYGVSVHPRRSHVVVLTKRTRQIGFACERGLSKGTKDLNCWRQADSWVDRR